MDYRAKTVVVIAAEGSWRPKDRAFWAEEFARMLRAPAARIIIALDSPAIHSLVAAVVADTDGARNTTLVAVSANPTILAAALPGVRNEFDERVPLNLDVTRGGFTAVLDGVLLSLARTNTKTNSVVVTLDRLGGNNERTDRAALLAAQWKVAWNGLMSPTAANAV